MTKKEALAQFKAEILPGIPKGDKPARDQAWCNYTDMLQKSGQITEKQCSTWAHPYN